MKGTIGKALCVLLAAALVFSLSGCAKVSYVTDSVINAMGRISDGSWKEEKQSTQNVGENVVTIEPFTAGTYGSVEFKTEEDVVNYYVECYNNTKAQTASYIDENGDTQEYYALVGEEKLTVDDILIDGSSNDMLNNVVPGIVAGAFAKGVYGLPPSNNRDPLLDNENMESGNPGNFDYRESYFKPEYCLACNVSENADGTIQMTLQPKDASMAARGADAQGSFFEVLKDLGGTVAGIFNDYDALSWASGTTEENCRVDYKGGTGTVTIDPKTKTITTADYEMKVFVEVNHANVSVIKDKSGAIYITHYIHYPASDDYLKEAKSLVRK